jgi:hypothetical protein
VGSVIYPNKYCNSPVTQKTVAWHLSTLLINGGCLLFKDIQCDVAIKRQLLFYKFNNFIKNGYPQQYEHAGSSLTVKYTK